MPAYAYAITIHRDPKTITESKFDHIGEDFLSIATLEPIVGSSPFVVHEDRKGGYTIEFVVSRLETEEETNRRVSNEEAYTAEYRKRHPNKG